MNSLPFVPEQHLRSSSILADMLQHPHHVGTFQALADFDGQAFSRVHVDYNQWPESSAIDELIATKSNPPHLIRSFCPRLLPAVLRHCASRLAPSLQTEPFLAGESVYQLLAHVPALTEQQHLDLAVPVANARLRQLACAQSQRGQRIANVLVPMRRSRQQNHFTGSDCR